MYLRLKSDLWSICQSCFNLDPCTEQEFGFKGFIAPFQSNYCTILLFTLNGNKELVCTLPQPCYLWSSKCSIWTYWVLNVRQLLELVTYYLLSYCPLSYTVLHKCPLWSIQNFTAVKLLTGRCFWLQHWLLIVSPCKHPLKAQLFMLVKDICNSTLRFQWPH